MKKTRVYVDAMALAERQISGIGHLTIETVRALSLNEHLDVILVLPLGKRHLVARHKIQNTSIVTLPIPARALSLLLRWGLLPPVDIFIGAGVYLFPNYRNWPLARSRSLTYFHDASFLLYPNTVSPKNLAYLLKYAPVWLNRADTVLTLSKSSKSDIVKLLQLDSNKVEIVSCGVDHEVFYARDDVEIQRIKHRYGLICDKYFLYVGNFEPRKNLLNLLSAYQSLPVSIQKEHALVLIGGGGWLNEDVFKLITELQSKGLAILQANSYVKDDDLPALFSGATALVHPALYEGFGLSPLQAMACGTPVVVADNSSLPEVVGDAGIYVDAMLPVSIANGMSRACTDKSLRTICIARGLVMAQKFSWKLSADQITALLEN